jgi:cytochrome c oxidase assembly protein subunit 15
VWIAVLRVLLAMRERPDAEIELPDQAYAATSPSIAGPR